MHYARWRCAGCDGAASRRSPGPDWLLAIFTCRMRVFYMHFLALSVAVSVLHAGCVYFTWIFARAVSVLHEGCVHFSRVLEEEQQARVHVEQAAEAVPVPAELVYSRRQNKIHENTWKIPQKACKHHENTWKIHKQYRRRRENTWKIHIFHAFCGICHVFSWILSPAVPAS